MAKSWKTKRIAPSIVVSKTTNSWGNFNLTICGLAMGGTFENEIINLKTK